jgi:hypothetical protein
MSERRLFRLGAVAAAISGVAIVAGKVLMLLPDPQAGEVLDFFSPLFGLFAVVAVFLWQRRQSGTFGVVAFVVMFIGLALVTSLDYFGAFIRLELTEAVRDELMEGSPGVVAGISGLTFLIGEILFSISILRAGVFPRAAAWMFMVGFVPMTLIEVLSDEVVAVGSVVAGGGIFWLGASLWRFTSDTASVAEAHTAAPVSV